METMVKAKNLRGLINGKKVKPSERDAITLSTYPKRES